MLRAASPSARVAAVSEVRLLSGLVSRLTCSVRGTPAHVSKQNERQVIRHSTRGKNISSGVVLRFGVRARSDVTPSPFLRLRYPLVALALCGVALVLSGCGGGGAGSATNNAAANVDRGGFTTHDRQVAQVALNTLKPTSVPGTIVQLTATIGLPSVCRVHFTSSKGGPANLDVILAWRPIPRSGDAFTWFKLTIGSSGVIPSSMDLGIAPNAQLLRTHYGVAYTRPFEPCRANAFGWLTAVPLTFAAYPTTGHARKIPTAGEGPVVRKACSLCVRGHKHS